MTETFLLSAYDIYHGLLSDVSSYLAAPEVVFVDSGGYEIDIERDRPEEYQFPYTPRDWGEDKYRSVLDGLPEHLHFVIVNLDPHALEARLDYAEQVAYARDFFSSYGYTSDFLVKPNPDTKYVAIDQFLGCGEDISSFDIIGVTEKELGDKMMDRLKRIAGLREGLDRQGLATPIHIFGSLDPLTSVLYFLAGAEIFDGLAWIKYAFVDGLAAHPESLAIVRGNWRFHHDKRESTRFVANLTYLDELTYAMKRFLLDLDFSAFPHHQDLFRRASADLEAAQQETR